MKNIFLSAAIACASLLSTTNASAQFNYSLTTLTDVYTPLTAATSVTNGVVWDSDSSFAIPVGFSTNVNGIATDTLHLLSGAYVVPQITAVQSGWVVTGTSLADRGLADGIAKSDIRYNTTGTAGNRIFKLEVFNAGFEEEYFNYGDLKDSISYQLWVYETSNVVEFRYGSSNVTYFNDYFGNKMIAGLMKDLDTLSGNFQKFYLLDGTSASPTIDSFTSNPGTKGLADVPAEGRVFRFTPAGGTTGIKHVAAGTNALLYPTVAAASFNIEYNSRKSATYTILNSAGQIMTKAPVKTGKTAVDVSSYAAGLYTIVVLDADNNQETHKIIKIQ